VELGEWFGAENVRPPLSDRDHPMTLPSIARAYRRSHGERLNKQTENSGIDGFIDVSFSCERDFIMKGTDANQVDDVVHQTVLSVSLRGMLAAERHILRNRGRFFHFRATMSSPDVRALSDQP
jgi:hypothetical protein